jgi:hypothetical protein
VAWPQPIEYNAAVQTPQLSFRDADLRDAQVAEDALGMPRPYSGNFADVYQLKSATGRAWAVKCFTREVSHLQARYQAISNHLQSGSPSFMVNFHYLADGIRIRGTAYPVVKMDWVDGFTLNEFVKRHVDKPQVMYRLAQKWVKLSLQLRRARMAHADLQHGNILLVPGEKAYQFSLRLIDYDGMYIPALANTRSGEVGHPNYQHPQRLREGTYNSEVDRFPHLLIYTALRCLTVGGRQLWDKYDNGENLLFREQDFVHPTESALLVDVWQLPDPDIRRLVGHLLVGSEMPLDRVAMLDQVVGGEGRPLALTTAQEHQVANMLPPAAARTKISQAVLSRFSLEELIGQMEDEPPEEQPVAAAAANVAASSTATATAIPQSLETLTLRRNTGVHRGDVTVEEMPVHVRPTVRPLLPKWQFACLHCRQPKHLFESICPHCHRFDWVVLPVIGGMAAMCLTAALTWLRATEAGVLPILGLLAAALSVVLVPLTAGLLARALVGTEKTLPDMFTGPRWPATATICTRCSSVNVIPLFTCRACGRVSWVTLAVVGALAATLLALVAAGPPLAGTSGWWHILTAVVRLFERLVGFAAGFMVTIGVFELWKLQGRLPKEGRLRTSAAQMALFAATVLPVVLALLFLIGLVG